MGSSGIQFITCRRRLCQAALDPRADPRGLPEGQEKILPRVETILKQRRRGPSFFPRSTFRLPGFLRGNQQAGVPCGLKQIADIPGGHPQAGLFLLVSVAVGFFKTETKPERTCRRSCQRALPLLYLPGELRQFRRAADHGSIARSQGVKPPIVGAFKVLRIRPEPARVQPQTRGPDQVIDNLLDKRRKHGNGRWGGRRIRSRFQ
jgi:hypothetical protein